jgi:hypothetical protein
MRAAPLLACNLAIVTNIDGRMARLDDGLKRLSAERRKPFEKAIRPVGDAVKRLTEAHWRMMPGSPHLYF